MQNFNPILIHVPHSSIVIPKNELKYFRCNDLNDALLKMTDRYIDELFNCGEDMLIFPISRLVCDVERFRNDNDEIMAQIGQGLAYTKNYNGEILRELSYQKRNGIVKKYYDVHHKMLTNMTNEKLSLFYKCCIIDAHSFPKTPLPYENDKIRPDICIGTDVFHTPAWLTNICITHFENYGYNVILNRPFSGTIIPIEHLFKNSNVLSIMIEINRGLYMNDDGSKNYNFNNIQKIICELVKKISEKMSK